MWTIATRMQAAITATMKDTIRLVV